MSRNGELALRKIIFTYNPRVQCVGMRQFFATHLPALKAEFPNVEMDLRPRRWTRATITGVYKDGSERAFSMDSLSPIAINSKCHRLAADANDLNVPFTLDTMHLQRRTVQGAWNPWLWRGDRPKPKKLIGDWDRKLTDREWDYYVDKYSARIRADERAIQKEVESRTSLHNEYTHEVQQRWAEHVAPRLQTDMQSNLAKMKADVAAGVKPAPVSFNEYRLFSVPDHSELGIQGSVAARRKEVEYRQRWWAERKAQLKSP